MLYIFRYILGYVKIKITGESPEEIINLLIENNISIWSIKRKTEFITLNLAIKDYKTIRFLRKKLFTRPKIRIVSKSGLKFAIKKILIRKSIAIGIVVGLILNVFMSNFIWIIEVSGIKNVNENDVVQFLNSKNISFGTHRKGIDTYNISQELPLNIPNIAWASLNIEGSKLSVNISEYSDTDSKKHNASNIIANYDGVIKSIKTSAGKNEVKIGQTVRKGELLVSGIDTLGDNIRYINAKGTIIAETNRIFKESIAKEYNYKIQCNETDYKKVLNVFGVSIPLFLSNTFNEHKSYLMNSDLYLFGKKMPISISERAFVRYEEQSKYLNYEEAKNIALSKFEKEIRKLEIDDILNQNLTYSEDENSYYFTLNVVCNENIALSQNIDISNY